MSWLLNFFICVHVHDLDPENFPRSAIFAVDINFLSRMLTGIVIPLVIYSLYTTVVQAIILPDIQTSQFLQVCDSSYSLTPCRTVCIAIVVKHTGWRVPVKTCQWLSLTYLSLLMISTSADIQTNPGPTFPCESCGKEVLDGDPATSCDSCEQWFHIQCQDMCLAYYETLQGCDGSFAWSCLKCDRQNYSNVSSSSLGSFQSHNSYTLLDTDSMQEDLFAASHSLPTSTHHQSTTQSATFKSKLPKLKILI